MLGTCSPSERDATRSYGLGLVSPSMFLDLRCMQGRDRGDEGNILLIPTHLYRFAIASKRRRSGAGTALDTISFSRELLCGLSADTQAICFPLTLNVLCVSSAPVTRSRQAQGPSPWRWMGVSALRHRQLLPNGICRGLAGSAPPHGHIRFSLRPVLTSVASAYPSYRSEQLHLFAGNDRVMFLCHERSEWSCSRSLS